MSTQNLDERRAFEPILPRAAGRTDVGRQRDHNEDRLLVEPGLDLFVVADGMGGHNAGEVASALAAVSIRNFFQATANGEAVSVPEADEAEKDLPEPARRLLAAVQKANRDVFEISTTVEKHRGMGSTLVALHLDRAGGQAHIAHVGDSRCYRVRGNTIEQLTRDHSLISDALAWNPNLTEDQLALLPKNVISRSLGRKAAVEVDLRTEKAAPGDIFLLCSDGLSGLVADKQILESLALGGDPTDTCETLIALANDAGGTDNVTVAIIRLDPEAAAAEASEEEPVQASEGPEITSEGEMAPDEIAELLALTESDAQNPETHGTAVLVCPTCNNAVPTGNAFCVQCGVKVPS